MVSETSDTRMAFDVISACLALFPCKIRPASATAWAWLKTRACEESRPLARSREKLVVAGRDLAAKGPKLSSSGGEEISENEVVSQLR